MTSQNDKYCWSPGVDRAHSVYQYTEDIYKIIQWYRVPFRTGPGPAETHKHYDKKLDSSVSRTRRVLLEKALCNDWEWFCTFTISEDCMNRQDLAAWGKKFRQWLRDYRKKGRKIRYLLVPEKHLDGSWHAHGFLSGLFPEDVITFGQMDAKGYRSPDGRKLPRKLVVSGYYNWPAYQQKFGFCSLGKIKNPVAAGFYITKYITKDKSRMVSQVGLDAYYCSQGLNVPQKFVDFFGRDLDIDRLLVNKYDFCATGMTSPVEPVDWHERFSDLSEAYTDFSRFKPLTFDAGVEDEKSPAEMEADAYWDFEQLYFEA